MEESESVKSTSQAAEQRRQREANRVAHQERRPLPYPNVWDALDPTKLPEGASDAEIALRYQAFCQICPPPQKKEYTI